MLITWSVVGLCPWIQEGSQGKTTGQLVPPEPLEETLHGHRPKKGMLVGTYATLSPKCIAQHEAGGFIHKMRQNTVTSNRFPHSAEVHLCALWIEEKVLERGKAERGSRVEVPTSHHEFPVSDLDGHCRL